MLRYWHRVNIVTYSTLILTISLLFLIESKNFLQKLNSPEIIKYPTQKDIFKEFNGIFSFAIWNENKKAKENKGVSYPGPQA